MKTKKQLRSKASRQDRPGRRTPGKLSRGGTLALPHHERLCVICSHPLRAQIENEFVHWVSPKSIAKDYNLGDTTPRGLYRHARAVGLWEKRFSWVRDSLAPLIEQADRVTVNAAAVIAAVRTVARINAVGQWVEPADRVYLRDLFDRMTPDELELYAREGSLPAWFEKTISATPGLLPQPRDADANAGANAAANSNPNG